MLHSRLGAGLVLSLVLSAGSAMAQETADPVNSVDPVSEPATQEVRYVTDRLILGVYPNSDGSGEQLRVVRSGAALSILEQSGRYAKIRTDDGDEGWVRSQYLVEEKPAALKVEELESELQALRNAAADPAAVRSRVDELESSVTDLTDKLNQQTRRALTLQGELDDANSALGAARSEAQQMQNRLSELDEALRLEREKNAAQAEEIDASKTGVNLLNAELVGQLAGNFALQGAAGVLLLLIGMLIGYRLFDRRMRNRFGGFRIG